MPRKTIEASREPDWDRLALIAAEAARKSREPGWNRRRWLALERRAAKATNGHPRFTEFMAQYLPQ